MSSVRVRKFNYLATAFTRGYWVYSRLKSNLVALGLLFFFFSVLISTLLTSFEFAIGGKPDCPFFSSVILSSSELSLPPFW